MQRSERWLPAMKKTARMLVYIRLPILLLCFWYGCISINVIRPDQLGPNSTKDIVVSTHDGRTILLLSGDYQVIASPEGDAIQGNGKFFLNKERTETRLFEGILPLSQIDSIEVRHYSIFHYTGPILFGTAAVLIALFAILFHGRSFG